MKTLLLLLEASNYVLKDQIAGLEALLKKHGYNARAMSTLFDAATKIKHKFPSLSDAYLDVLNKEKAKLPAEKPAGTVQTGDDAYVPAPEELQTNDQLEKKTDHLEKRVGSNDEGMIRVLGLLSKNMKPKSKDKARVLAARMKVDPDVYRMAGLGTLPENYTDEDVWKTLDMGKDATTGAPLPFYDHAWQTLYTTALEQMQSLPLDMRDEIEELLTTKEPQSYPTKAHDPYSRRVQDDRIAYECKIIADVMVEGKDGIEILPAGAKIRIID